MQMGIYIYILYQPSSPPSAGGEVVNNCDDERSDSVGDALVPVNESDLVAIQTSLSWLKER